MNPLPDGPVTLSIVSHGHGAMLRPLLADLRALGASRFEILLTLNIPEDETAFDLSGLDVKLHRNAEPRGFGANHNAAFARATGRWFAVVNPDVRVDRFDIAALLEVLADARVGACAPLVLNPAGGIEDSARRFPTVLRLARRVLTGRRESDYRFADEPLAVDWVAGMFILFRREAFQEVGGFDDERFFMYMEDVDICERLGRRGWSVVVQPKTRIVHDARRDSHRNWRHLRWHLGSALRYLGGW
jgi:N-acetylglucosaminyl-diphospho-decaprenol L-rhamnosyltransferase